MPIKSDPKELLRQSQAQGERQYPASRAGWYGPENAPVFQYNPTYEQMRFRYTPAGRQMALWKAIEPDWKLCALLGLLIFTLRYYKWHRPPAQRRHRTGEVIEFPQPRTDVAVEAA